MLRTTDKILFNLSQGARRGLVIPEAEPAVYPPLPCLLRLLPPVLDSNETAVLVGQSAYPVGNV